MVNIAPTGDAYAVSWSLPSSSYDGVGILEGDLLVVGWDEFPAPTGALRGVDYSAYTTTDYSAYTPNGARSNTRNFTDARWNPFLRRSCRRGRQHRLRQASG